MSKTIFASLFPTQIYILLKNRNVNNVLFICILIRSWWCAPYILLTFSERQTSFQYPHLTLSVKRETEIQLYARSQGWHIRYRPVFSFFFFGYLATLDSLSCSLTVFTRLPDIDLGPTEFTLVRIIAFATWWDRLYYWRLPCIPFREIRAVGGSLLKWVTMKIVT